jgi:hypothetical protein
LLEYLCALISASKPCIHVSNSVRRDDSRHVDSSSWLNERKPSVGHRIIHTCGVLADMSRFSA